MVFRELAVTFEDSGRLDIAFVGARGLAIEFAEAHDLRYVYRRGRPRYPKPGRARPAITSAGTGSFNITSSFVGGPAIAYG